MSEAKKFAKMDVKNPAFVESLKLTPVIDGASVDWVRSEDHHVYLVSQHTRGWAPIEDPFSFAILAAARAANISVSFFAESYDPNWGEGAGLFLGVSNVRFQGTPF